MATNNTTFVARNTNTKTIPFSYGIAKNAELEVPTEDASIVSITQLIHKSLVNYKLNSGIISDSVILSSLGTSHFLKGAVIGWVERFKDAGHNEDVIKRLKNSVYNEIGIATAIAEYRYNITDSVEQYKKIVTLDGISDETKLFFETMITIS